MLTPGAGAEWMQEGYDSSRTGLTAETGPVNGDIALRVQAPREATTVQLASPPIVVGNHVYFIEQVSQPARLPVVVERRDVLIHDLDLTTGAFTALWRTEYNRVVGDTWLASDGARVFLVAMGRVVALDLPTKQIAWRENASRLPPVNESGAEFASSRCAAPALSDGRLAVACSQDVPYGAGAALSLRVFNAASGAILMDWSKQTSVPPIGGPNPIGHPYNAATQPSCFGGGSSLAVADGIAVLVSTCMMGNVASQTTVALVDVYAVRISDGTLLWSVARVTSLGVPGDSLPPPVTPGFPLVNNGSVYVERRDVVRYNLTTGATITTTKIRSDPDEGDRSSGMASDDESIFVTLRGEVRQFNHAMQPGWRFKLGEGEATSPTGLVVYPGCLIVTSFVGASEPASGSIIQCLDPASGVVKWSQTFGPQARVAVSNELLVVSDGTGVITVVGTTPTSIALLPTANTLYPAAGATFALDLSKSNRGSQGPATKYRVDWGDGDITPWQSSARLVHRYALEGDFVLTAFAANDAGQESSTTLMVQVGGTDPSLSAVERAFLPKNQEKTFFVLGLFATLILAGLGLLRYRLRHSRMQRELRAIETAFAKTEDDPDAAETLLREKKSHVRDLLLTRRLDESQCQVLNQRIDELHRGNRMRLVDTRFEFLPHGMVKRLRAVLEDGRVTELERSHFLEALTHEATMTAEQKANVKRLVEGWFDRDRTRTASGA